MTTKQKISLAFSATALALFSGSTACNQKSADNPSPTPPSKVAARKTVLFVEGLPADRAARMKQRREAELKAHPPGGMQPNFMINSSKRWSPGTTVTLAFRGGSTELHRQIARIASTWTSYGNIGIDTGYDIATGRYRTWSLTDTTRAAQIRVGFDAGGYWSCVGADSVSDACARPAETSLNLNGFDEFLPERWDSVVLHEFGHAFGFEHEHQNPQGGCDDEFRWEDDPGYVDLQIEGEFVENNGKRPGLYKWLSGAPNRWERPQVDFNLRSLPNSSAYLRSEFDRQSIMKYEFPAWMFRNGEQSRCFSVRNVDLSVKDVEGMGRAYPRRPQEMMTQVREQLTATSALAAAPVSEVRKMELKTRADSLRTVR